MNNPIIDQAKFMVAGDQSIYKYNADQAKLYVDLVEEEYLEFTHAVRHEPIANQIKECVDLIVVSLGFLYSLGIDVAKVWFLVNKNNMMKVTNVKKTSTGKIIKSPETIANKASMMFEIEGMIK